MFLLEGLVPSTDVNPVDSSKIFEDTTPGLTKVPDALWIMSFLSFHPTGEGEYSIESGSSYEIPVQDYRFRHLDMDVAATAMFVFIWLSSKEPKYVRAQ